MVCACMSGIVLTVCVVNGVCMFSTCIYIGHVYHWHVGLGEVGDYCKRVLGPKTAPPLK